jgi:hypothetical protein
MNRVHKEKDNLGLLRSNNLHLSMDIFLFMNRAHKQKDNPS